MSRSDATGQGEGSSAVEVGHGAAARGRGARPVAVRAVVLLVLGAVAGRGEPARAADCGGGRPCQCGDRVVADHRLAEDLGPCEGLGLRLRGRVVLDGAGHAVRGRGAPASMGVVLDKSANESQVLHLEVTGFERGVRLNGVSRARLFQVHAHHNGLSEKRVGYGIDVAGGASDNRLERVEVDHNADEGIHLGSAARDNRLSDSTVHDNGREDVYLLKTAGTVIERCKIGGAGSASIYVKHSKGAVLRGNETHDVPVVVRGGTTDLLVVDHTFRRAGFVADPYEDARLGSVRPARLTLRGGSLEATGSCVNLGGASGVQLEGVALRCGDRPIRIDGDSDVTVVGPAGAEPGEVGVQCAGSGTLRLGRGVDFRIVDGADRPLEGATVRGRAAGGKDALSASADDLFPELRSDAGGHVRGNLALAARACPASKLLRAKTALVQAGPASVDVELAALRGDVAVPGGESSTVPVEVSTPSPEVLDVEDEPEVREDAGDQPAFDRPEPTETPVRRAAPARAKDSGRRRR